MVWHVNHYLSKAVEQDLEYEISLYLRRDFLPNIDCLAAFSMEQVMIILLPFRTNNFKKLCS
jgi:hypothetical protein